jgi:glycyl-tRNA synthetase
MAKKALSEADKIMEELVSLCKRRGFIFQSSLIYGGINSCWDYGPLGVELKNNIKRYWWKTMTQERDDIEGLDASIIMHPRVWEASGHVAGFTDPLVDCKKCKHRFREDEIDGEKCPDCGGELTDSRQFNLMFKTFMGPVEEDASVVYLRPETAQGIYVNFQNVLAPSRQKIPFGIAQIGKAFRNEITPGNFVFRMREFEQMEMQYFVRPGTDEEWFEFWKEKRLQWYHDIGITKEKLRYHEHGPDELAHYAAKAFDIEYEFPFGWKELEGIHNRTDFDLGRHQEYCGKDLSYFDQERKERYVPYIIETSAGVDRSLLTCLVDAYAVENPGTKQERTVLKLSPKIAPIKAAILPLVNRDGMPEIAEKIADELRPHLKIFFDTGGSVGRRYRRQDEAGTPFGITVDSQTLEDETVTLRERDSMQQERVKISALKDELLKRTAM